MPTYKTHNQKCDLAARIDKISREALAYYNAWSKRGYQPGLGQGLCANDNWNVANNLGTLAENSFLRAIGDDEPVTMKFAKARLAFYKTANRQTVPENQQSA